MNWDAKEVQTGVDPGADYVSVSHWLMPGPMEVYRVEAAP